MTKEGLSPISVRAINEGTENSGVPAKIILAIVRKNVYF
jgi:hypothetical protein